MEVTAKGGKIVPKEESKEPQNEKKEVKPEKKPALLKKKRGRPPKQKPEIVITEEKYEDGVKEESFVNTQESESVSFKGDTETVKIPTPVQKKADCKVGVVIGYTKNLGNYESIKINLTAEEHCEKDAKDSTWDRLMTEARKKLVDYLEQADSIKAEAEMRAAITTNISGSEAMRPVSQQTKVLLNQFMKQADGLDYYGAIEKLRQTSLTEIECRQIIDQVSRGDFSFFEDEKKKEEQRESKPDSGNLADDFVNAEFI